MNEQIVNKQIFFVGDDALIVPKPTVIWILQRDDEGIVPYEYFVHRLFIHAFGVLIKFRRRLNKLCSVPGQKLRPAEIFYLKPAAALFCNIVGEQHGVGVGGAPRREGDI